MLRPPASRVGSSISWSTKRLEDQTLSFQSGLEMTGNTPEHTRFHEAGDAVVGVMGGAHLSAVVTRPANPNRLGHCIFMWGEPQFLPSPLDGQLRLRLHERVCMLLAGEIAATIRTGAAWPPGCIDDHAEAHRWIGALTAGAGQMSDPEDADRYFRQAEGEVQGRLAQPTTWRMIEALAEALVKMPNIFGADLTTFFLQYNVQMPVARL